MSQATQEVMQCKACGLKYPWSERVAGKKIKCKCGALFIAPTQAHSAATTTPRVDAAVARMTPPPAAPARAAAPAAPRSPSSPPLPPGVKAPAAAASAAKPVAKAPARPAAPVVDLEDEVDDNNYDLADDLDAPPPLAPVAMAPVAAATGAPARSGKPSGPMIPGYRPKKHGEDPDAKKAEIKKILIPVIGVVVLIGVIIGLKTVISSTGGGSEAKHANLPGEDGRFERMAEEDGKFEARAWMAANNARGVVGFFWSRGRTEQKIEQWYKDGAKNVYAFGQVMTATLAIELPDDPAKRKPFIDYINTFNEEHNRSKPKVTDVGQKYVLLDFM